MAISDDVGRISKEIIYSTFGEVLKVNIKEVDSLGSNSEEFLSKFNLFFTSRFYDSELGLYDFRNRYYHAPTGRFTSMDPKGLAAGDTNYYRYVGNNPINYIDPFGLDSYLVSRDIPASGGTASHNFILIEQNGVQEVISFGQNGNGNLAQGYNPLDSALSSFGSGTLDSKTRISAPDYAVQGEAANLTTYLKNNEVPYTTIPIPGISANSNSAAQAVADGAQGSPVTTPNSSYLGAVGSSTGVCGY